MTEQEKIWISAYTGVLFTENFSYVHKFIEYTLNRPVLTHELANPDIWTEIREKMLENLKEFL